MAAVQPLYELHGMTLAGLDRWAVLDRMFAGLARGEGGWLITANVDFLRRYVRDAEARALYDQADLRIADGMPLVWAARLQGDHVPERVPGSSLVSLVAERAEREGRSLYLLGGTTSANEGAVASMRQKWPALRLVGASSPTFGSPPTAAECQPVIDELRSLRPDLLLVGLGSPKQEQLIRMLRPHLPATWMIGVGISFSFLAGELHRAPAWMQGLGLEWLHRLAQEPGRLGRRYLIDDIPFAIELMAHALTVRGRRALNRRTPGG